MKIFWRTATALLAITGAIWMGSGTIALADEPVSIEGPIFEPASAIKDITSVADIEQWTAYYYLFPQPDLTVKSILVAEQKGLLDCRTAAAPMLAFYSQVFAQNPKKLGVWIEQLKVLKPAHKEIIWGALKLANTEETKKQAHILESQLPLTARADVAKSSQSVVSIEQMDVSCPAVLDMLWASFFATGDERYIKRIMTVLPTPQVKETDVNR
jgi:hypothetical protein